MIGRLFKKLKNSQNGDTIVEVMISMAVLGVVMGTAYATSTRSFQAGLNSQYRDQAVYYAQQQVELLKNADNSQPSTISSYQLKDQTFCVNPGTMAVIGVEQGQDGCPLPIGGSGASQGLFSVALTYNDTSKTFTSTVHWTSGSNRPSTATIFYKPNDSFADALGTPPLTGTSTAPPTIAINFTADDPNVDYNSSTTLRWSTTNANKCWKSGGAWGNDATTNIGANGSYPTGNLTSSQSYLISCSNSAGQASSVVSVNVSASTYPKLQTLQPIVYGNTNVYFRSNINPNGYATTAWYQWGNTPALTGCQLTTSAFGEPAVNYSITDTRFGSYWGNGTSVNYYNCNSNVYWYRVCAYNTSDTSVTVCGDPVEFGLLAPSVVTGGATQQVRPGVSNSSHWDLAGTINPNGNNIDNCYFQYDNDSDLSNGSVTTSCASSPGGGTSPVGVGQDVDLDDHYRGEDSNATFYYRLCAYTSVGLGTTCGSVQSFHTR